MTAYKTATLVLDHGREGRVTTWNPPGSNQSWAASSGNALQFANSNQVAISNRSNIRVTNADERLRLT